MFSNYKYVVLILLMITTSIIHSQSNDCSPSGKDSVTYEGTSFFNYSSTSKSKNQKYKMAMALGQVFVGYSENVAYNSNLGFYSRYLLPPFALNVNATQGDLLDRIQLSWEVDGLGPSPNEGFNIYRDGVFLESVGANIRNYNDFNVIAGVAYEYTVRGLNSYGEGVPSYALGFQVPNGVVTGWIRTGNGNPVPNTVVTLMPMQGFSAKFDASDQAVAAVGNDSSFIADNSDWTMTFWLKTNSATTNAGIISIGEILLYVRSLNTSGGNKGIELATLPQGAAFATAIFPDTIENDWNHVTLSFENAAGLMRIYINGTLATQTSFTPNSTVGEPTDPEVYFRLGNNGSAGGWDGYLDELRIYNALLGELELPEIMHGTASSQTEHLEYYWKMDEELGEKSYDIKNRVKLFFCGVDFDIDRPPVRTAGKTNEEGYYRIESASYGTGTTFIATPSKNFYLHKAVSFKKANNSFGVIPNFPLPKKSTIEVWVNNTSNTGIQTILSKKSTSNLLRLYVEPSGLNQVLKLSLNGSTYSYGNIGTGYQHLAITIDSMTNVVQLYKNGVSVGSNTYSGTLGNFADGNFLWTLGANSNSSLTDYFQGLIDEVAVYDTIMSLAKITEHFMNARDMQEQNLYVYFPMDEGSGNRISNVGSKLLNNGELFTTTWNLFAPNQEEVPHEFLPKTRQVTLNPSVTSVDQVDFTDRSTVPVSGYIRYKDTECFAPKIEILVNGESFSPKIFTDSTGKFVIDFDPGFTAKLTPKFEDHIFVPAFWDVTNVNSPIAGILFNNTIQRTITGKVAGGLCELPILDNTTICTVKLSSTDDCFERTITLDNVEGNFTFTEIPPLENYTLAVVEHSEPSVKSFFEVEGGANLDLSKKDTLVKFIYFAPPEVTITSGLDPITPTCDVIVLDKFERVTISISMKEVYEGGDCTLDTGIIRIINGFADQTKDTTLNGGTLNYSFQVGDPNPSPPFLKTMQILGISLSGRESSIIKQGVVTGIRSKESTFTSKLPNRPFLVLRDPPGDGSFAYIEKGKTICQNTEIIVNDEAGAGGAFEAHLGGNVEIGTGLGVMTIINSGPILDVGTEYEYKSNKINTNTWQNCITTQERISTDDSDLLLGKDSDIFMGTATNIIFGYADAVTFDEAICEAATNTVVNVDLDSDYKSTYLYSRWQIENYLIPNLTSLAEAEMDSTIKADYLTSIEDWSEILIQSDSIYDSAKNISNLSFSSGIEYERTFESSVLKETTNTSIENNSGVGFLHGGYQFNKAGFSLTVNAFGGKETSNGEGTGTDSTITVGYVLTDDDAGDAFSIDLAEDTIYKTPIFKTIAGQSSCPWETATANREAPNLQLAPGSQFVATDVPANEPAVFQFQLGNLSATNETWTYSFGAIPANNPYGAIISLNGQQLTGNSIQYIVPYGTSKLITLTVEKGPIEYDYDSLLVAMYSECQYGRNYALSLPLEDDSLFFSSIYIGAHFTRPCSKVNINVPQQGWVLYNSTDTPAEMNITVSGYNRNEPNFSLIRVQYRKENGDGAWINIPGIFEKYNTKWNDYNGEVDTLGKIFTHFMWNTEGLSDGSYEIRAVAVCTGDATDAPGFSQIIKGRIDREPPKLLGKPQPSDGVYNVGDEISFTFNQDINCNKLIQADIHNENNVGLYDATTDQLLDVSISCKDNKIILDPSFNNEYYENKILRAELHNIEDLVGNTSLENIWEFYVDRNELAWLADSIEILKFSDESKTIIAKIHNRGGYPVPFTIYDIPDWLHVYPDKGTLVANEIMDVHFSVDENLDLGEIDDVITLHTEVGTNTYFSGGNEPLYVKARNLCRPEKWVLNPSGFNTAEYDYTMNFILQLNIEGTISLDENDIVGAYIDGELRGIAKIQYQAAIDKYIAFLTVYSNNNTGEEIKFQIWDASDCKLYAYALETFDFEPDQIQGTLSNCVILHTNTTLLRKIFVQEGWNWLSMNLDLVPNDINSALSSLSNPTGALVKDQTTFSTYTTSTSSWIGTLSTLGPTSLYQYKSLVKDSISIIGHYIDPTTRNIALHSGWNWIGYIPTQSLSVNEALTTVNASNGDIIKSQLQFAQFLNGVGWIGNLKTMNAPNGYLLLLHDDATLTYPDPLDFRSEIESGSRNVIVPNYTGLTEVNSTSREELPFEKWQVDPTKYEYSMNAIAIVVESEAGNNLLHDGDEVAAFVNNEVRGSGKAIFIPALNSYMIFMTIYANVDGERMELKYFDSSANKEYGLQESVNFKINSILGQVDTPEHLHLSGTTSVNDVGYNAKLTMYPNPFANTLHLHYKLNTAQQVTVTINDVYGKLIETKQYNAKAGSNNFEWKPITGLSGGTYLITVESEEGTCSNKVLYIK